MIIDGLLTLIFAPLELIVSLLPAYSGLPSGMESSIDYIATFTQQVGDILPTSTMWTIIVLTVAIELSISVFNLGAWMFHWKQTK